MKQVPAYFQIPVCAGFTAMAVHAKGGQVGPDLLFGAPQGPSAPGTVITRTLVSSSAALNSLAVQSDGRIIASGRIDSHALVACYLENGSLDPAFGRNGLAIAPLQSDDLVAKDLALQPDGKIVVVANRTEGLAIVVRYLSDGTLDPSFGGRGIVRLDTPNATDAAHSVAVLSDGKILIAGIPGESTPGESVKTVLWRLLPNGSSDPGFGVGGLVTIPGASGADLTVQPDGKTVIAGTRRVDGKPHFWLARCDPGGSLDPAFGDNGTVTASNLPPSGPHPPCITLQSDGKILVAGEAAFDAENSDFLVARFTADGHADLTFNGTGGAITNITSGAPPAASLDMARAIAVQRDGKVLAAGSDGKRFTLLRFHPDGRLDHGFGESGVLFIRMNTDNCGAGAITFQPDGKFLVGGWSGLSEFNTYGVALARYFDHDNLSGLSVELPGGNPIHYGETVDLGKTFRPDVRLMEKTLILRNTGNLPVTGISARIIEWYPGNISVSAAPAPLLEGAGTTPVTLTFTPPSTLDDSYSRAFAVIEFHAPERREFVTPVYGAAVEPRAILSLSQGGWDFYTYPATVDFGPALTTRGITKVFTILNSGTIDLTIQGLSLGSGGNPADFTVGTPGTTMLAAGESTTFSVTFVPTGPEKRSARLRIASTDSLNPPREVDLTGTLATGIDEWRLTQFAFPPDSEPATDSGDPDHDGICNLLEYAAFTNPNVPDILPGQLARNGASLEFTFPLRSVAPDVTASLEWTDSLNTSWNTDSVTKSILSDDGTRQLTRFTLHAGNNPKRFVRLRVTRK